MNVSVFQFHDYKKFLKSHADHERGAIGKMATAAQCQRSYLSKVLSSEVHLTPDQGFHLTKYFQFNEMESDFFQTLLQWQRSGSPAYRHHLENRMKELKSSYENLANRVSREQLPVIEDQVNYYSQWFLSAVHILTSISAFQTEIEITKKLSLPRIVIFHALKELQRMGLVKLLKDRWIHTGKELHLPSSSPLIHFHHQNWRNKSMENGQKFDKTAMHFTSLQSMNQEAFEAIRGKIAHFIEEQNKIARPAEAEQAACLCIDFFTL